MAPEIDGIEVMPPGELGAALADAFARKAGVVEPPLTTGQRTNKDFNEEAE